MPIKRRVEIKVTMVLEAEDDTEFFQRLEEIKRVCRQFTIKGSWASSISSIDSSTHFVDMSNKEQQ